MTTPEPAESNIVGSVPEHVSSAPAAIEAPIPEAAPPTPDPEKPHVVAIHNWPERRERVLKLSDGLMIFVTALAAIATIASAYEAMRFEDVTRDNAARFEEITRNNAVRMEQITRSTAQYSKQVDALESYHIAASEYIAHAKGVIEMILLLQNQLAYRKTNPNYIGLWEDTRKTVDDLPRKYSDYAKSINMLQLVFPPKYTESIIRSSDVFSYFNLWGHLGAYEVGRLQNPTNNQQEKEFGGFNYLFVKYLQKKPIQDMFDIDSYLASCLRANLSGYEYQLPNTINACNHVEDEKLLPAYLKQKVPLPYPEFPLQQLDMSTEPPEK